MKLLRNGIEIYDIEIDPQTTITRRLMVENSLTLRVDTAAPLDLRIGDYVTVDEERYVLLDMPDVDINANGVYGYDALLLGNIHRLENWLVEQSGNESFYYYGTASDHIAMILKAIREKEAGWNVDIQGSLVAGAKNIDYASMSCLSALHKFCEEFNAEFDVIGKTITVAQKTERPSDFDFAVGRGKGLYKISRGKASGQKITTRMFGLGGKTNMADGLRLTFEQKYVERNVDLYGLREDKVVFDDIFPRRNSAITSNATQLEEGKVLWRVNDSTMDFDLNKQLVDGAKIVFNSGDCAGVEFEISSYDDAAKTITFKEFTDESQTPPYTLPRAERYPRVGDEYVYTGITMPESYVTAARAELLAATEAEISRSAVPQHPYTVDIDPRYIKLFDRAPRCGDLVRISHAKIGLDAVIRIVGVTFAVVDPSALSITINDKILISSASSLMRTVRKEIAAVSGAGRYHPMMGNSTTPLVASTIRVMRDLFASGSVGSADFMAGLLGAGWNINAAGNGEMDSLILRTFLSTPELVKNQIRVIGSEAWLTENGVVAAVRENPFLVTGLTTATGQRLGTRWTGDYFVSFHDEKANANGWFRYDDILRGIYNFDDGFRTVYLRVVREVGNGYILRPLNGFAPTAEMVLARQGNFSDPARQGSIYLNSAEAYIRVLGSMNGTSIVKDNLMAQLGSLENLREFGISDMPKVGIYTRAGVFKGLGAADVGADISGTAQKLINAYATALEGELGSLAFKDMVETAQLGSTVIQGGYIKTDLINAQAIAAQEAFITKLLAQEAFINNLTARSISTAESGRRVAINKGSAAISLYNNDGKPIVRIDDGGESKYYGQLALYHPTTGDNMIQIPTRQQYNYTVNGKVRLMQYRQNGLALLEIVDSVGVVKFALDEDGITLPPTARMDMPGVLAAGRVTARGVIDSQWGCKTCRSAKYNGQVGKYKIEVLELTHTNYFINVTPVSNGNWTKVHGAIIDKKPPLNGKSGYFVVGIYDSGYDNTTLDYDFEFMICGQN